MVAWACSPVMALLMLGLRSFFPSRLNGPLASWGLSWALYECKAVVSRFGVCFLVLSCELESLRA
ncbi:hypothetical protein Tco_1345691, partial [Tanacetum coccineum]